MTTLADFESTGALLTGHFRLSSGRHSERYLQCARLLQWPQRAGAAGRALARALADFSPSAVVSPAMGGVIIGHEVARALSVPFAFAERQDGAFTLRRGFRVEPGASIAIVEDVFTTGRSTREVMEMIETLGAGVVAVGSIVNRGLPPDAFRVPSRSLLTVQVPSWTAEECPLCARGVSIDTPGSRWGQVES
ncbi:MAG: orotate phosphoribosyltransferase [Acidobacteria bacterium]|nr:orotate phosphoribosyltransferase [Acidobacteriota bacterium]MCA1610038.1 orotate phosphoribosyltransferase [Acidobacteriota bacterium]